jgi:hypothetical protein
MFGLVFLLGGCKESEDLVKAGQPFAEQMAPPFKTVVYIYWPAEEQGRPKQLGVGTCDGPQGSILPAGYISLVVNPGPNCFRAERQWELTDNAFAIESLAQMELNLQPGHASFVRLERGRNLLFSRFVLRPMTPEAAKPEIGRCRQTIPLSTAEMMRVWEEEARPKRAAEAHRSR